MPGREKGIVLSIDKRGRILKDKALNKVKTK